MRRHLDERMMRAVLGVAILACGLVVGGTVFDLCVGLYRRMLEHRVSGVGNLYDALGLALVSYFGAQCRRTLDADIGGGSLSTRRRFGFVALCVGIIVGVGYQAIGLHL